MYLCDLLAHIIYWLLYAHLGNNMITQMPVSQPWMDPLIFDDNFVLLQFCGRSFDRNIFAHATSKQLSCYVESL